MSLSDAVSQQPMIDHPIDHSIVHDETCPATQTTQACKQVKEALYRIWCGANRLGDSGVHTLGNNSAFVNPAGYQNGCRRHSI